MQLFMLFYLMVMLYMFRASLAHHQEHKKLHLVPYLYDHYILRCTVP